MSSPIPHLRNEHQSVSCRGVVSRFPFLSGIVASAAFLTVSFFVLAVCLVPALRWQYGGGPIIPKAIPSTRSRALPDALGERRVRKRSLKRSGSVGPIKREVWCLSFGCIITHFPSLFASRIMKAVSPYFPLRGCPPSRYVVAVRG